MKTLFSRGVLENLPLLLYILGSLYFLGGSLLSLWLRLHPAAPHEPIIIPRPCWVDPPAST